MRDILQSGGTHYGHNPARRRSPIIPPFVAFSAKRMETGGCASFHAEGIQYVPRCGRRGMTHVLMAPLQPAGRSAGRIRRCTSGGSGHCCLHRSPPAGSWTQTRPATTIRPLLSMGSALASYAGPTLLNLQETGQRHSTPSAKR